jgi:integrase
MSEVFKLRRFALGENGERIPLLDKQGRPMLVKHGPEKGKPAFKKEEYRDSKGKPRWRARVYDPVGRKYKVKTFREKGSESNPKPGTAWHWVKEMEVRRSRRQTLQGDQRSVAEYIGWWIDAKARGDEVVGRRGDILDPPRYRTVTLYRKMIERWITGPPDGLPPLGIVRMDQLTHGHLDSFYRAMRDETTVGVVRRLHAMLGQAFAEAVRKGYLAVNPCDAATAPRKPRIDETARGRATKRAEDDDEDGDATSRSLTEGQAGRFLASARELAREGPYSALWHLLTLTGLRPTEAFALDWKDLDLDGTEPKVRVRRSLVLRRRTKEQREQNEAAGWHFEPPKTRNGRRDVPLPALAAKELRAWKLRQEWHRRVSGDEWTEHGLVFTTGKGTPLGSNNRGYRGSFVRLMAHAHGEEGEDGSLGRWGPEPVRTHLTGPLPARRFTPAFRVYDLRHTYVTLSLAAGVPPHVVSKLAGHATVNFTLTRYAKALPSQKQEAAAMMDRMFGTSA